MGFTGERPVASSRRAHDGGFTLVEVIVAGVIMVMVLVPSAILLSSSAKVLTITQAKIVAANLAGGVLDEDRAVAGASVWAGTPVAPTLPTPSVNTVNGVTFSVSQTKGWCALSSGAWANYVAAPAAPPAYGILVQVSWLGGAHSVTAGAALSTPMVVVAAGVGNSGGAPSASAACPL